MNKKAKGFKSWPAFRGRNARSAPSASYTPPFTELPDELKPKRFSFKSFFQGALNFIFLAVLGLALLALVAAFAFIWITQPDKLVTFFSDLVKSGEAFIASLR